MNAYAAPAATPRIPRTENTRMAPVGASVIADAVSALMTSRAALSDAVADEVADGDADGEVVSRATAVSTGDSTAAFKGSLAVTPSSAAGGTWPAGACSTAGAPAALAGAGALTTPGAAGAAAAGRGWMFGCTLTGAGTGAAGGGGAGATTGAGAGAGAAAGGAGAAGGGAASPPPPDAAGARRHSSGAIVPADLGSVRRYGTNFSGLGWPGQKHRCSKDGDTESGPGFDAHCSPMCSPETGRLGVTYPSLPFLSSARLLRHGRCVIPCPTSRPHVPWAGIEPATFPLGGGRSIP